MAKRVLTITMNPALDISSKADEVLTDQKIRCETPQYDPGGGGINVARVLTRLGVEVDAHYFAGGVPGEFLKKLLQEEKMHVQCIEMEGNTRENVSIIDQKTGEQYRFVFPGPTLDEKHWKKVLEIAKSDIDDYEFVVASGSLPSGVPKDFYSQLGKIVLEQGKKYILDTSGEALLEGIQKGATFIKPNQEEFEQMKKHTGTDSNEELIRKMFDWGVENIIYTEGGDGTTLLNENGSKQFTPPQIEVNSSIGAGDSFIGGLVAGLTKKYSKEDSVCYGISAASSTLQSAGTELCSKDEVESIHRKLCGKNSDE